MVLLEDITMSSARLNLMAFACGPSECIWSLHCFLGILTPVVYILILLLYVIRNNKMEFLYRVHQKVMFPLSSELGIPEMLV